MAELVDAADSKSAAERCESSSLSRPIENYHQQSIAEEAFLIIFREASLFDRCYLLKLHVTSS